MRQIGRKLRLSPTTVGAALAAAKPAKRRALPRPELEAAPPVSLEADAKPPSVEELAGELAATMRHLQADAQRAREAGDDVGLARAQRHLGALAPVLARLTKNAPSERGVVELELASIDAAAARCREALASLVLRELGRRGHEPKGEP